MKLLLVRHAIAEDAESFAVTGGTDALRPLTEVGRRKMRKGTNRLRTQIDRIDVLACSPRVRARETAESSHVLMAISRYWSAPNWILSIRLRRPHCGLVNIGPKSSWQSWGTNRT